MKHLRDLMALFLLVFIIISLVSTMFAQDSDPDLANDPYANPDANACFAGGSWEGKCGEDLEMWRAGWYLIRWEHRIFPNDVIPDQYKWILPDKGSQPNSTEEP